MEDNQNKTIVYIILSVLFIFISIGVAFYLLIRVNTSDNTKTNTIKKNTDINTKINDKTNTDDSDNDKYTKAGNPTYGYIKLPGKWYEDTSLSTTDAIVYTIDKVWYATLSIMNETTENQTAEYSASLSMYYRLNTGDDIENIKPSVDEYNGIKYYKVSYYYVDLNKYLSEWYFEPGDGKIHSITIEGNKETSEYFDSIKTFSLN